MTIRQRRMISKTISTSEKIHNVGVPARLLFTWMILHCDDEGRIQGSAKTVKAIVFPMADFLVDDVYNMLVELHHAMLIILYKIEEKEYIQINKWNEFQTFHGVHKVDSKIPRPPSMVSKNTNISANIIKVNISKDNIREGGKARDTPLDNSLTGKLFDLWKSKNREWANAHRTLWSKYCAEISAALARGYSGSDLKAIIWKTAGEGLEPWKLFPKDKKRIVPPAPEIDFSKKNPMPEDLKKMLDPIGKRII